MGMVSAALMAASLISELRPRYLVMPGICAGVKGKAKLGDVLLADPSWDWQSGKRTSDKNSNTQFAIAPHQLGIPSSVRAHVEQLRADIEALQGIAKEWKDATPGRLSIVIGPMASGSAVLAHGKVIEEIRTQHRELCGIEMEAYGIYAAAHSASTPQPIALALKSVCDFGDAEKNDQFQRYAAYTSAQVVRLLFERFGNRLLERRST
jgi:nucleoside phosphorylase